MNHIVYPLLMIQSSSGRRESTALLAPGGGHAHLTTRRARRVRSQPRVDASHVESMAALRQRSDFVSGDELRQANGAVGEFTDVFDGVVSELREGIEDFLLEAFVRRRRRSR